MKKILNWVGAYPHKSIGIAIPILLFIGWVKRRSTIDIQLHDTYFVLDAFTMAMVFSIILGITAILYFLLRNRSFIPWMSALHVLLSTIAALFLLFLSQAEPMMDSTYFRMDKMSFWELLMASLAYRIAMALLLFFFVQCLFLGNLIIALFRKKVH